MKKILYINLIILIWLFTACANESNRVMSPNQVVAGKTQNKLFVADETANRISIINAKTSGIEGHISLEATPGGLVLSADEARLFVTLTEPQGKLLEIDWVSGKITRSLAIGHSPMSPVISTDGKSLFLCNRFNNSVSKIDLERFTIKKNAETDREPVDAALLKKKDLLLVANHLPNGKANADYHSAKVSVFKASTLECLKEISLPNGSNALNRIAVSADEKFAYLTHILARYNVPTNQVERGWINTNALSIIDLTDTSYLCTVMLDDLDRGAANPYDVKCSEDGKSIYVSHTGTNELSIIDSEKLHQRITNIANGTQPTLYATSLPDIQNDLSFLQDIRERIDLKAKGPKGLTFIENRVFVSMYFSGSVAEIDRANKNSVNNMALGVQPKPDMARLGKMYFNDATLCKQQWQSCTSCHPGDARVDALNWDLLNDGIGNPKNTKSMLLAHATPPAMITGIRHNANVAVRAGIEHILFTHQPDKIAEALDAYLAGLRPVPSPYLRNGELTQSAQRGKQVFEKAQCSHCHSGPYFTNMKSYNVGEGTGLEEGRKFDTPSLVEAWRTAPYLYDGKARNIKEVITIYNTSQRHGKTADLTEQELDDLVEYCLSL
ncbi:MAG: c-type cytochrome [Cytophagales bacterium]|nr:c-type cytochrome [Cytophagales bacterium]